MPGKGAPGMALAAAMAAVRNNVIAPAEPHCHPRSPTLQKPTRSSISFSFSTALSGVVTTGRPEASATMLGRGRHAVLGERDQVAIAQILGCLHDQAIMRRAIAAVERGHGAFRQFRHDLDGGRKLPRHRRQRRRERRQQADLAALA